MFAKALVTGATGRLGSLVVERLRASAPNVTIGARSLAKVAGFPKYGFDVCYLDYDLPASWEQALLGKERLLLVPPPVDPHVDSRLVPLVQRAVSEGVERIVLVSHLGVQHPAESALARLEGAVRNSGVDWAIVRPNWFLQDMGPGGFLYPALAKRGVLAAPAGEGRVSFVDARDVADAVVSLLVAPRCRPTILRATGPHGLSFGAMAALCGLVAERSIRYMDVDPEVFEARLAGPEWPPERVSLLGHRLRCVREGGAEVFSGELEGVLGREVRSADAFFLEGAGDWKVVG